MTTTGPDYEMAGLAIVDMLDKMQESLEWLAVNGESSTSASINALCCAILANGMMISLSITERSA